MSRPIAEFNVKTLSWKGKVGIFLFSFGCLFTVLGLGNTFYIPLQATYLSRLLVTLVAVVMTVVLHESVHGLTFKLFTGRVSFGIKFSKFFGPIPYATSPGSLLSRGNLCLVSLAPQVLTVSILTVLALNGFPVVISAVMLFIAALNLAGGCVDIYAVIWSWKFPRGTLFEDTGIGIRAYGGLA